MTALGFGFADNATDFRDSVINKIMFKQALEKLSDEEKHLVAQLFYLGRTERELATELHVAQQNINKAKRRILCKLYEILKE